MPLESNKILRLDQKESSHEIHALFQKSYKIEADLAKAEKFPPLLWTAEMIQKKPGTFLGIKEDHTLIACIQIYEDSDQEMSIYSLVVHPSHFKKSLASQLLDFVLNRHIQKTIFVETAAANEPAISLYKKFGFQILKTYVADLNIEKVRMALKRS